MLIETVFDTLNGKAAIFACQEYFQQSGRELPLIVSGTITDASGRTLSGQTAEAFWYSVAHAKPLAVGLNCALGAEQLREHIYTLAQVADVPVSTHPNAGSAQRLWRIRSGSRRNGGYHRRIRPNQAWSILSAVAVAQHRSI